MCLRRPGGGDRKKVPTSEMFPRRPGGFAAPAEMFLRELAGKCSYVGPGKRPNAMFRRGPDAPR